MITSPWTDLLDSLADAIARRSGSGWPGVERATAALDVARADVAEAAVEPFVTVQQIARYCSIDEVDVAILVAAAAAELDPTIHLITGLLSGDDGPGRPTVALVLELVGSAVASVDGLARIGENSLLRRTGLLEIQGSTALPARRCRVPDRVVAALLGDDRPAASVRPLLIDAHPVDVAGFDTVARALEVGERFVWVHAPHGSAGVALAAAACRELSVGWLAADLSLLPRAPARTEDEPAHAEPPGPEPAALVSAIRGLLLEAAVGGRVLVATGVQSAGSFVDAIETAVLPVILVGERPWDPHWSAALPLCVTAPRLTVDQRTDVWMAVLDGKPERDVAALRLTPEQINAVARHAFTTARIEGLEEPDSATIRDSVRQLSGHHRGRTTAGSAVGLDNLVLPAHTRAEIERLLTRARYRDDVTHRRTAARARRRHLRPVLRRSWHGQDPCCPRHRRRARARPAPGRPRGRRRQVHRRDREESRAGVRDGRVAECAAVLRRSRCPVRFTVGDQGLQDRYANTEIAYLLQRMEAFDGITVLATNLRGNLDAAFARRLHFIVHFPDPDAPTRRRLWELHLTGAGPADPDDPVDLDLLASARRTVRRRHPQHRGVGGSTPPSRGRPPGSACAGRGDRGVHEARSASPAIGLLGRGA